MQVEHVTVEVPFTRAHCRLLPDAEEVAAAESLAEHVLEDAPADAPLLSAMAAANAAAGAAAIASAQVGGSTAGVMHHAFSETVEAEEELLAGPLYLTVWDGCATPIGSCCAAQRMPTNPEKRLVCGIMQVWQQ